MNLANPVGRLGADAEVSGGGSWRSPVRSYPEGRAKRWPHADDSLPGRTDRAGHGRSERPWPRLRRGRRLNWPAAEDGHDTCRDLTPSFMSWPAQLQIPSKRLPTTRV